MTNQVIAVDRIRITFALRELAQVQPWGDAKTGPSLSWFGHAP